MEEFNEVEEHGIDPESVKNHHDTVDRSSAAAKSAFNTALASLDRINDLLNTINQSYLNADRTTMRGAIKCLYMEICPKLTKTERINFIKEFNKLSVINREGIKTKSLVKDQDTLMGRMGVEDALDQKSIRNKISTLNVQYFAQLEKLRIKLGDYLEVKGLLIPGKTETRFLGK